MSNYSVADQRFMTRAMQLAREGTYTTTPNPRVGCVLVDVANNIVGEGYHVRAGEGHAEVKAIANAGAAARGTTAYVTLEPCSHTGKTGPCCEALVAAGVSRVVYGMEDPNPKVAGRGLDHLEAAGIQIDGPVLEYDAYELNPGFIKRMRQGLPLIRIKMAMSLDGRTAMADGTSKWITSPRARDDVQRLRARSCAIITGVDSVLLDDPSLTVRLSDDARQPLRVIVDSNLRLPTDAAILSQPGKTVIATCANLSQEQSPYGDTEIWTLPEKDGRVSLQALARKLAQQECNEVLVETGATLAGAFVSSGLVDELVIYMAGKLLGSTARPLFDIPISKMSAQLPLSITDIRAIGDNWRITAIPDPEG